MAGAGTLRTNLDDCYRCPRPWFEMLKTPHGCERLCAQCAAEMKKAMERIPMLTFIAGAERKSA